MQHAVDGHVYSGGEHLPSDLLSGAAGTCYNPMAIVGQCEQSCMAPRTDTKVHEDHMYSWEGDVVLVWLGLGLAMYIRDIAAASGLHRPAAADIFVCACSNLIDQI